MAESTAPVAPITPSAPAATSAPAEPTPRTYTEAEFNEVKSRADEYERISRNAAGFIEADPDVRERLGLYNKSFTEKKPYLDLVKEWENGKRKPESAKPDAPPPGLTEQQVRDMIRRETEGATRPFVDAQSRAMLKETQEQIRKDNPWVTDKDMETFDQRFNELCTKKAQQIYQSNYPRMNQQQAWDQAVGSFVDVDDQILFDSLMKAEREESILGKRRTSPKLPDGMVETISTGKDPDLLEKARKAYSALEGDGDKVAALLKEYAPQFGIAADDRAGVSKLYSLISK